MDEDMIAAKLAELAAISSVCKLKCDRKQFWDGELRQELNRMEVIISELHKLVKR